MFFRWLTERRRRKLLARPFPAAWADVLDRDVLIYGLLTPDERAKIRDYVQVFVAEKNWEGCGGLDLTDEMKVVIAAQAGILVVGLGPCYFDNVLSILVYPDEYVVPDKEPIGDVFGGVYVEEDSPRLGEAWYRGPVILTWTEVLAGARRRNRGRNVVFHEFAHQLDMLNGRWVDGMPPMKSKDQLERWTVVLDENYDRLCDDCDHGRRTPLDCYGSESIVEFFAVATEAFFDRPAALRRHSPALYDLFREFYGQDPAAREPTTTS